MPGFAGQRMVCPGQVCLALPKPALSLSARFFPRNFVPAVGVQILTTPPGCTRAASPAVRFGKGTFVGKEVRGHELLEVAG